MSLIPENKIINKEQKNSKVSIFVYGEPMVGKTHFANTFPNPLFLNTDGNTQDIDREVIDLRNVQNIEINGETKGLSKWSLFKYYVHLFNDVNFVSNLREQGYETIVIDVVDHLYDWCREAVLSVRGIEDESEDSRPFSPIYGEIKKEFKKVIVSLIEAIKSDFNLVLVSFEDAEEYQEGLDKKLKRVPSLKKKLENSQGVDKAKTFEAITSRISMITGIFVVNQSTEDGVKESRAIFPFSTKDYYGGNRFGLDKPTTPKYEEILKGIKGE